MPDTQEVFDKILKNGEVLIKELYDSIDKQYVNLIRLNFNNLSTLVGEYSTAYVLGDSEKVNVKRESIEHTVASIISVAFSAINNLSDKVKNVAFVKLSELLAFFSTQFIVELNRFVLQV